MTAQQGYPQLHWQSHLDPFHPGMIASQYPHSIKSAIFREGSTGAVLKFGTGCGRHGGDTQRPASADNFTGAPPTGGTGVRYAAGGGAYVTDTISYEAIPAGLVAGTGSNVDGSATLTNQTLVIDGAHKAERENIMPGDYLQITDSATGKAQREIVRVLSVTAVSATAVTCTVLRGQFGTGAVATIADNDEVNIYARTNTFAGVALKDITIEGRWVESETDSFANLDEVPVGIKGDFAIVLDYASASAAESAGVTQDAPVSMWMSDDTETTNVSTDGVYRPRYGTNTAIRNRGLFRASAIGGQHEIVIKGARYVTGPYEANLWTRGTRGPGSGGEATVVIAAARFASNV